MLYFLASPKQKLLALVSILTIFLIFFIFENNSEKLNSLLQLDERSSLNSRLMIWKSALKILSDNWLWGIGPGNFQIKYLEYQKYFPLYLEWAVPQPHNLFLAFWLQTGLIGFLGFILLIINFFCQIIKRILPRNDSYCHKYSLIILAIILCTLINGLFDTPYWKNDLSLIFWSIFFLNNLTKLDFNSK
jgi:O-antigen ligase